MKDLPVTIYTPESSLASPVKMLRDMFHDLADGRELAWRLVVRDINAQYRQAYLGILWAFILPLANTLVWIFLSKAGVVNISTTSVPYPLYVFIGTMLWAILMDSINSPLQQVISAKSMLSKLNFPREALILSGIYQTLFNASIKVVLMLVALIPYGINPGWSLLLFPFAIFSLVLVGTALGMLITPLGMLYSDIGRGVPLMMQFLMYITPVVFPIPKEGWTRLLFNVNPFTPIILTARDWLTGINPELVGYFSIVNGVSVLLFFAAWIGYRLAMPILIERMSS